MCHATRPARTASPFGPADVPATSAGPPQAHPRDELRRFQDGACAACGRGLARRSYFHRDLGGLRVAGLVCMACATAKAPVADPPVLRVDPLLRLRLTFGTTASAPRGVDRALLAALDRGDWDAFASPLHALYVQQGGRCALHRPGKPTRERCSSGGHDQLLYVDHDHATGLARALLCPPCNSREGWGCGSPAHIAATQALRTDPPAQRCPATAGLTYRWLTGWARPAGWSPARPPRHPSRVRPRPPHRPADGMASPTGQQARP